MKKKTKPEPLPRTIPFTNNKGDIIHFPAHYKIEDLLAFGVTEVRLAKKGSFLPGGWYKNTNKPERKHAKPSSRPNKRSRAGKTSPAV